MQQQTPTQAVTLQSTLSAHRRYLFLKRAIDIGLGGVLFIAALPLLAMSMLLIRLTSRGPAWTLQTRLGRFGRPFDLCKLRSTFHTPEKRIAPRWPMRGDPRMTPVGRVLRTTHIDELPQLWNVVKGDMSLTGPRPERPEFMPILETSIPEYRQRLLMRPGMTGMAQLYLPPDTGVPSQRKKVQYDFYYINKVGLLLDLRLLFAAALKVLGASPPSCRQIALLPSAAAIEQSVSLDDWSQPVMPQDTAPVFLTPLPHYGARDASEMQANPETPVRSLKSRTKAKRRKSKPELST